ncbi:putative mitogen-activated protein kinase kinase kinase 11 [Paratrimastix pyriformis]|uniref:Mitogen-activated protein kinase kinase kinase 11 n=1 Tax=Paratrimastix pyriformis TaxID=342808 RepID=A0ABQ8UTL7_9EUKA|nr:putative mitogen-activated protein kinase kinase kinase 11 [Paratrimastix pyriformis]
MGQHCSKCHCELTREELSAAADFRSNFPITRFLNNKQVKYCKDCFRLEEEMRRRFCFISCMCTGCGALFSATELACKGSPHPEDPTFPVVLCEACREDYCPSAQLSLFRDIVTQHHSGLSASDLPVPLIEYRSLRRELKLGGGGFGVVYRGTWTQHGSQTPTPVAVKEVLPGGLEATPEDRRSTVADLVKEAVVICSMQGAHLVRCHGLCVDQWPPALILELGARSLRGVLDQHRSSRLPWPVCAHYCLQVALGLSEIHRTNDRRCVVHRDLKPENVLLFERPDGNPMNATCKLVDFGMCKVHLLSASYTAGPSRVGGTMGYMAPELFQDDDTNPQAKVSPKLDIWAFGVILWEFASGGRRPYEGMLPHEINIAVYNGKLPGPIPTDIPAPWQDLIRRCLQTDPRQRPTSDDLVDLLRPLEGTPAGGRPALAAGRGDSTSDFVSQFISTPRCPAVPPVTASMPRPLPPLPSPGPSHQPHSINISAPRCPPAPPITASYMPSPSPQPHSINIPTPRCPPAPPITTLSAPQSPVPNPSRPPHSITIPAPATPPAPPRTVSLSYQCKFPIGPRVPPPPPTPPSPAMSNLSMGVVNLGGGSGGGDSPVSIRSTGSSSRMSIVAQSPPQPAARPTQPPREPEAASPPLGQHCTFADTGVSFVKQMVFRCRTCGLLGSRGCCALCARVCHRGHDLFEAGVMEFYCDCGYGRGPHPCQCMPSAMPMPMPMPSRGGRGREAGTGGGSEGVIHLEIQEKYSK